MAVHETPGSPDMGVVQFRIERGAAAMGPDGQLGTVEQVVVDRDNGALRALVIRRPDGQEYELPATHIQRSTGQDVYLDVGAADLADHPEIATPYNPAQYVPVFEGDMAPDDQAGRIARETERPVVTDVEPDAAQVVAPTADTTETLPRTPRYDGEATQAMPAHGAYADARDEASDLGMRAAFSAGAERHLAERAEPLPDEYDRSLDAQDLAQAPLTSQPDIAEQETVILSQQLMRPDEVGLATETPGTGEQSAELSQPEPSLMDTESDSATPAPTSADAWTPPLQTPEEQRTGMAPLGLGLAAAGLASGVLAGLVVARRRRQASAASRLQDKASQLAATVAETAGTVQDTLKETAKGAQPKVAKAAAQAQVRAQRAGRQTQKTASRANRRFRWFRRGMYLGSALALLYTPQSGAELRTRLAAQLDQWRSRMAS